MKHLTTEELANRWGMNPTTLCNWRVAGRGPKFMKFGKNVLYALSDIEEYEANNKKRSTVG